MYLTWEPPLSEQCLCDLRLKVAEINGINSRTAQTKRDLRCMLIRERGIKQHKKLRSFLIRLLSERGISRHKDYKDESSQERKMYFFTIIQKIPINYSSSSLKVGISAK